jgi:tripartite-type tricarboxylate transporter receptor subunit TctC
MGQPVVVHRIIWQVSCSSNKAKPTSPIFRIAAQARLLQDLMAGNVDMMFDGLGSSAAHIKGGRIKALMVSGNKRKPSLPRCTQRSRIGHA